jgi:hypothetical protein
MVRDELNCHVGFEETDNLSWPRLNDWGRGRLARKELDAGAIFGFGKEVDQVWREVKVEGYQRSTP